MSVTPETELAIRRLLDRYVHCCDTIDVDAVARLFGDDGVLTVRGRSYSGDAVVGFYRARLTVPTLHAVTGLQMAARADGRVDSTCGFTAVEMRDEAWTLVIGRYTDVVEVRDLEARFVERTIDIVGKRVF